MFTYLVKDDITVRGNKLIHHFKLNFPAKEKVEFTSSYSFPNMAINLHINDIPNQSSVKNSFSRTLY